MKVAETGHYAQCTNYNYLGSRCDGGFAQYCIIPSKWHLIFSENKDVTSEALAMVEPATVAQHAVRRAEVTAGDNVLIFGATNWNYGSKMGRNFWSKTCHTGRH